MTALSYIRSQLHLVLPQRGLGFRRTAGTSGYGELLSLSQPLRCSSDAPTSVMSTHRINVRHGMSRCSFGTERD